MARVSVDKVLNIARGEIGVPMPEFLVRTVKSLKGRVDNEMSGRHFADEEISKDKESENRRE